MQYEFDFSPPEKLMTLKEAAEKLGLPPFKLYRAANRGMIPVYRFFNGRQLVRLSEVVAIIDASRKGGSDVE